MLVNILIVFFLFLVIYTFLLNVNIIEGMSNKYKDYDTKDPNNALILAQQNAGNIEYLKERMNSVQGLDKTVADLSNNYAGLQQQVDELVAAQAEYATSMTGGSPPEISGAVEEDEEEGENKDEESEFIA